MQENSNNENSNLKTLLTKLQVLECNIENVMFTEIILNTPWELQSNVAPFKRYITVRTPVLAAYFMHNYKHLGITPTNVNDFILRQDVKYKMELEDVKKFIIWYLYGSTKLLEE